MFESCCCTYDYHGPEVCRTEIRRAAKEHRCCECGATIKVGERHQYVTGKWDGFWDAYRTCMPCKAVRDDRMSCGWAYGRLWEDLRECLGGYCDCDDEPCTCDDWLCPEEE